MPTPLSLDKYGDDIADRAQKVLDRRSNDGSPILDLAYKRIVFALASYKHARDYNIPAEGAMLFLEKAVHLYLSEVEGKDPVKEKW